MIIAASSACLAAQVDESGTQPEAHLPSATATAAAGDTEASRRTRLIEALELKARQIRELMDGRLAPTVDLATLFDVELDDDAAIALEAIRLQSLLKAAGSGTRSPGNRATSLQPNADLPVAADPLLWDRRIALDRARLAFYQLSPEQRAGLLQAHAQRRAEDANARSLQLSSEAEQRARAADAERKRTLDAAQRARSEAQRVLAEERARLLAIESRLAQQEAAMAADRVARAAQTERTLTLRREVRQLLEAQGAQSIAADELYQRLRSRLRVAREELAEQLAAPRPVLMRVRSGEDTLAALPAEISRAELDPLLDEVAAGAKALLSRQLRYRDEQLDQLFVEVQTLNTDRLALLPRLSVDKRSAITGFTAAGIDQAIAEVRHLTLVVRYRLRATFRSGETGAERDSASRVAAAGTVAATLVKIALAVGLLFWTRRLAAVLIANWRDRMLAQSRRVRSIHASPRAALAAGLLRVLSPTGWLLLIAAVVWVLPETVQDLLEIKVLVTLAVWSVSGWLAVVILDSIAKGQTLDLGLSPSSDADDVRLRSLRLAAVATVAVGLLLSLSYDFVGKGTIYSWVTSMAWWMTVPLGLVIVHWWRPIILERLRRTHRKGHLERWLLTGGSGWRGLIVAGAGGIYLFAAGALTLARGWLGRFRVTRRLLAHLFRQELDRIERSTTVALSELPPAVAASLWPSTASTQHAACADDAKVSDVAERIERGGGVFAVVGERGSGRSTVLRRLLENHQRVVAIDCPQEGSAALTAALTRALDLPDNLALPEIAAWLDSGTRVRVIAIDNAHRLIRPVMGGLADFGVLTDCARRNSGHCAWVLTLDRIAWRFYSRARPAGMLFDAVVNLGGWTESDIANLLEQRSRQALIAPTFDRLIPEYLADADDYARAQAASRLATNYYDLIWDYAAGNPGVALHTWTMCLGIAPDGSVQVAPFRAPDSAVFDDVPDSAVFVLRAVLQLEQASVEDVAGATMLATSDVEYALRFGEQRGYLERVDARYAITWHWYRPITQFLQRRHLLVWQ